VKIARDFRNGNQTTAYEYGYNSDGGTVWTREYITNQHFSEFRFVACGTGCAGSPLSLYLREQVGGNALNWNRVEEYVNAPTVLIYDFVLYEGTSGNIIHYDGTMVFSQYKDSFGIDVGGYALPVCATKRDRGAGCVPYPSEPYPEMPLPFYLPPYEPPRTNPGDYEAPLPGPWDDFIEAIDCSANTLDANRICRPSPEYYDQWKDWCLGHPDCLGNTLCCHLRCMEHVLGHRWDEFVWRWVEFYEDVIERVPRKCVKIR